MNENNSVTAAEAEEKKEYSQDSKNINLLLWLGTTVFGFSRAYFVSDEKR